MKKIAMLSCIAGLALMLLPTTIVLLVGGLPSIVAFYIDRTRNHSLSMSVLFVNLAAATTYLIQLWLNGHAIENALQIVSDPSVIIVIYSGALAGYGIHAVLGGVESEIMYSRAKKRKTTIKKLQAKLVERWGKSVSTSLASSKKADSR